MNIPVKESTAHRVCLIDYYPIFLQGLKNTYKFTKAYNIPLITTGKKSLDTQKIIYHMCLSEFCTQYAKIKSEYPKVMVFYPPKESKFSSLKNIIEKIIKVIPVPVCKVAGFNNPDVFYAGLNALEKNTQNKNSKQFAEKLNLYVFSKYLQKNKTFSQGTVDISQDLD